MRAVDQKHNYQLEWPKHLMICIYHKLSWVSHINYSCSKASQLLGFLKGALNTAPIEIKDNFLQTQ